jgi:DNA-binding transcriptional MerR regulator
MSEEVKKTYLKRYYSISEVAEMVGISQAQLRHWEKEFKQIHPQKNRQGERRYTGADIDSIYKIHDLLKIKKYTIQGAKKALQIDNALNELEPSNKEKAQLLLDEITYGLKNLLKKL